ncbi:hypothetical protein CNR22_15865 [Sphingobacteriaceae bacterium]|nr:hypothetical protein CNR22_15865 [Sphingobacteriaceae bacterium]
MKSTKKTASQNLQKAIQEIEDYAIVLLDFKGTIIDWNKGAQKIKGYAPEEIIGKNFTTFYTKTDVENGKPAKLFKQAIQDGIARDEGWRVRKGGDLFWASITITATHDEENSVIGFIKVTRDLTERKRSEEMVDLLVKKLSYQNTQLLDFAHITSHNLRSPVGNIGVLLTLYKEAKTQDEKNLLFSKLESVSAHLSETLNLLLESLKIKEDINKERENLKFNDLFQKVSDMLTAQITESKSKITTDFSQAPEIKYPKIYLESIFLNLLTNSIKYASQDRTPEIHFETKITNQGLALVHTDNGLGIDLNKYKDKIFGLHKIFHRVENAKGVGLFMTRSQIEAMGGTISVKSEVNKGSVFTILFNQKT